MQLLPQQNVKRDDNDGFVSRLSWSDGMTGKHRFDAKDLLKAIGIAFLIVACLVVAVVVVVVGLSLIDVAPLGLGGTVSSGLVGFVGFVGVLPSCCVAVVRLSFCLPLLVVVDFAALGSGKAVPLSVFVEDCRYWGWR